MKRLYLTLCTSAFAWLLASSQKTILVREFPMRFLNRDSVIAYYDENYLLVEDSCAVIIRRGFFNDSAGMFTGPFEDRSKAVPKQVVAKGRYSKQGLKEGEFATWYLNGKMQARGNFKENRFDGIWDFYSPSGKPRLTIDVNRADITIMDSWDEDGHRMVRDGKGTHDVEAGPITWSGKIINGKPHGKWEAKLTYIRQSRVLATETFSNGIFEQGTNAVGSYRDSSRIHFLASIWLPMVNAETLLLTKTPCNGRYGKRFVYAHPPRGAQQFIDEISERLTPLVSQMDTTAFEKPLELQMKISEVGKIVNDSTGSANIQPSKLKAALLNLPALKPATNNGKPVEQGIKIRIDYFHGKYYFNYVLLPIEYI